MVVNLSCPKRVWRALVEIPFSKPISGLILTYWLVGLECQLVMPCCVVVISKQCHFDITCSKGEIENISKIVHLLESDILIVKPLCFASEEGDIFFIVFTDILDCIIYITIITDTKCCDAFWLGMLSNDSRIHYSDMH